MSKNCKRDVSWKDRRLSQTRKIENKIVKWADLEYQCLDYDHEIE